MTDPTDYVDSIRDRLGTAEFFELRHADCGSNCGTSGSGGQPLLGGTTPAKVAELHQRIVNLPSQPPANSRWSWQNGYHAGHKVARHAAAELAVAELGPLLEQVQRLTAERDAAKAVRREEIERLVSGTQGEKRSSSVVSMLAGMTRDTVDELQAEVERLAAEVERLRADADRLDGLQALVESEGWVKITHPSKFDEFLAAVVGNDWDIRKSIDEALKPDTDAAAIDAARKGGTDG